MKYDLTTPLYKSPPLYWGEISSSVLQIFGLSIFLCSLYPHSISPPKSTQNHMRLLPPLLWVLYFAPLPQLLSKLLFSVYVPLCMLIVFCLPHTLFSLYTQWPFILFSAKGQISFSKGMFTSGCEHFHVWICDLGLYERLFS